MNEHNITVEGGSSVRLTTAGKYCDRDIVVTASGHTYPYGKYVVNYKHNTDVGEDAATDVIVFGKSFHYEFADRTDIETVIYDENITHIARSSCYNSSVKRVVLPTTAKGSGDHVFQVCKQLHTVELPDGTKRLPDGWEIINYRSFAGCAALTYLELPDSVKEIRQEAFRNCTTLEVPKFPENLEIIGAQAFQDCKAFVEVDLPSTQNLNELAFNGCSKLTTLALRHNEVCKLSNKNAITGTLIENGNGYIYVPSALIDEYKKATNWTVYADKFRVLEEYTIDGTVTGALDSGYCTSITLNTNNLSFTDKTPQQLFVTTTPKICYGDAVTWHSSDNKIAKVFSNGLVTPESTGNCIITASCGDYSASCNITVSENISSNLLYCWDFTQSLVDVVSGMTATIKGATQDKNGLTFTETSQYCNLGAVIAKGRRIEIDVVYMALTDTEVNHRFVMWDSTNSNNGPLLWSQKNKKWGCYNKAWYLYTLNKLNAMSGKIVTIDIDVNGYAELFLDGVSYGITNADSIGTSTILCLGNTDKVESGGDISTTVIAGLRIYEI